MGRSFKIMGQLGFDSVMAGEESKQLLNRTTLKRFKTIDAEDIMSIPTSLTRGESVFASEAELAVAQEAEKTAKNLFSEQ